MDKTRRIAIAHGRPTALSDPGIEADNGVRRTGLPALLATTAMAFVTQIVRFARPSVNNTNLAYAEIGFFPGYEDPGSLVRAFRDWTGETPESVHRSASGRRGG